MPTVEATTTTPDTTHLDLLMDLLSGFVHEGGRNHQYECGWRDGVMDAINLLRGESDGGRGTT